MQKKYLKKILILLILIPSLYLIYVSITYRSTIPPVPFAHSNSILEIDGFSSSNYQLGSLTDKISATKIMIRPKKIRLFRIRNINEIVIENLQIEQILRINKAENMGIFSVLKECLPQQASSSRSAFGRIAGGHIKPFRFKSWSSNKKLLLDCQADYGEIDSKKFQIEFKNITLRNPVSGRSIFAKSGSWNPDKKRFEIAGNYQATSPSGNATGQGISVDLYYHLEAL